MKPIVFGSLVLLFWGCDAPVLAPQKGWALQYTTNDSLAPNTNIAFSFQAKTYHLGDFVGKFDTFPNYLKRVDLPDSTIAVCRGKWTGGNHWLAVAQKNNQISFFQANEDSENYYEDYEEVLHFRTLPLSK